MGAAAGLPVGLSIIGAAWDDARVLAAGHAYEARAQARVAPMLRRDGAGLAGIAAAIDPPR